MGKTLLNQYAKSLRKNNTDAENHLWYYLRAKRLGYKFKRQVPISSFIVDFICYEKKLIIELDGGQHQQNNIYDEQRTIKLNSLRFKVLRFWNNDVLQKRESILDVICHALSSILSREKNWFSCFSFFRGRGGGLVLILKFSP